MLLGCSLRAGGYISISGIWGFISKARQPVSPTFEDESSGLYFYMKDKGKNWPLFTKLCPELEEFEFWDENENRIGTLEQERFLYKSEFYYGQYAEQLHALERAGLKEVEVAKSEGTNFPPSFMGEKYLYGTLSLSLPMPHNLQIKLKELITKENNK